MLNRFQAVIQVNGIDNSFRAEMSSGILYNEYRAVRVPNNAFRIRTK
ncbi:hypothetical protein [Spirosoma endophyticum]|nr:hypothetical protein [Spirosoma endophyticum]